MGDLAAIRIKRKRSSRDDLSSRELKACLDELRADLREDLRDEMEFMEQEGVVKLHQELNELKSQVMRDGKKMAVRMDMMEQKLVVHQEDLDHQKDVNQCLFKEVVELKEASLKSKASDIKSMKMLDSISGRLASLEERREQPLPTRASTGVDSGSRSIARIIRTDSGVQREKYPCQICGKLLSFKTLRYGEHDKTKRCKEAADAAAAAVRTGGGTLIHGSEDEIPSNPPIIIEFQDCNGNSYTLPQAAD